jgi:hypothetical protein
MLEYGIKQYFLVFTYIVLGRCGTNINQIVKIFRITAFAEQWTILNYTEQIC